MNSCKIIKSFTSDLFIFFISLALADIETRDIGTRNSNYLPPKWLMIRGFYQAAKSSCAGNGDFVFALTLIFKAPPQGQTQILRVWFFIFSYPIATTSLDFIWGGNADAALHNKIDCQCKSESWHNKFSYLNWPTVSEGLSSQMWVNKLTMR